MAQSRRSRLGADTRAPADSEPSYGREIFAEASSEVYADAVVAERGGAAQTAQEGERLKRRNGFLFWMSLAWVGLMIFLDVFAQILPFQDPDLPAATPNEGPSLDHLFGTDALGRDMLSRIVHGARVSLTVGFASIFLGILVGGFIGVVAGYFKGRLGNLLMSAMDVLLAFPALVFALAIVTFLGQNLRNVTIAIAVISIAPIA